MKARIQHYQTDELGNVSEFPAEGSSIVRGKNVPAHILALLLAVFSIFLVVSSLAGAPGFFLFLNLSKVSKAWASEQTFNSVPMSKYVQGGDPFSAYSPSPDENACNVETRELCCTDPYFPVLGGMDLVHYRLTGAVTVGSPAYNVKIEVMSHSYTFWFSVRTYVAIFQSNPEAYLPKWGGFNGGEFCKTSTSDFKTLVSRNVDLGAASALNRQLAFFDSPISDPVRCDAKFQAITERGLNTRCVLTSTVQLGTVANQLKNNIQSNESQKPLSGPTPAAALDVPVAPSTKAIETLFSKSSQQHVSGRAAVDVPVALSTSAIETLFAKSSTVENSAQVTKEFMADSTPDNVVLVSHASKGLLPAPSSMSASESFIAKSPTTNSLPFVIEAGVSQSPLPAGDSTTDDVVTLTSHSFRGSFQPPGKFESEITPLDVEPQARDQDLFDAAATYANAGRAAQGNDLGRSSVPNKVLDVVVSLENSEKILGEKALLKKGLEDPSKMSPGLRGQVP